MCLQVPVDNRRLSSDRIKIQDEIDCECRPGPNPLWQHNNLDLSRQVLILQRQWTSQEWKWKIVYHNLRDGKTTEAPLRDLPHHSGPVGELHVRLEQFEFELIGKLGYESDTKIKIPVKQTRRTTPRWIQHKIEWEQSGFVANIQSHACIVSKIREIFNLVMY